MRRPWNIIDLPVYSLATLGSTGINMNICTYVSGISRNPKKYMIALEPQSQTYLNFKKRKTAVLQILSQEDMQWVNYLGKKSGKETDKEKYLQQKQALSEWKSHEVLKNASALVLLQLDQEIDAGGDHQLMIAEVIASRTLREDNILMFQDLVESGIIL
ncbi:flavin reductase [Reichenbachiella ulvae]|uniref:Flavin reductase n=1 Tax=Reichenbachiella ulvae TaxID=2980104 RepID=A0ABT3CZH9_9BACT|nr:flavin reductase [Reichenbachiella ulvae]MCV9388958.1 flavin reductase [Reichenbachiella ulvae]